MATSLHDTIKEDMKDAMRAKDKARLGAIRLLLSAIKQQEVDEQLTLGDTQIHTLIAKMVKQRKDSIQQYEDANRPELAEAEALEIAVIQRYLPEPLTEEELKQIIQDTIAETGAESMKDMGKVMAALKPKVVGKADMGALSGQIKALLS